mgnify:CR=1 FL=1
MTNLPPGKVTQVIAAITGLAFALAWVSGLQQQLALVAGFIPARAGGLLILEGALPAWLTPLSATLVHAGLLHLGFNLLLFVYVGRHVESVIGGMPSLILYVAGAYAAALLHWAISPGETVPMVGASGAISATFGAYAVFFSRSRTEGLGPLSPFAVRVLWLASAWIFIQSLIGMASMGGRVAIFAHIGGFVIGLALARPLLLWRYRRA